MSRSLLRSTLELRSPVTRLPPAFLLLNRARWLSTATTTTTTTTQTQQPLEPPAATTPPPTSTPSSLKASRSQQTSAHIHAKAAATAATAAAAAAAAAASSASARTAVTAIKKNNTIGTSSPKQKPHPNSRTATTTPPPQPTGPIPAAVKAYLPLLRSQPGHYITVHIHGRPYLVTAGDTIRLPFLMPDVQPGDVLRLNRASVLGSRDFTLRPGGDPTARSPGAHELPYVDERLYECRATVVGVDAEPMRTKEKTKRRNRKVKTVRSKHRFTVLRISELRIRSPAEVEG